MLWQGNELRGVITGLEEELVSLKKSNAILEDMRQKLLVSLDTSDRAISSLRQQLTDAKEEVHALCSMI